MKTSVTGFTGRIYSPSLNAGKNKMKKQIKVKGTSFVYPFGIFNWVRKAVAPFDKKKAAQVLESLGLSAVDAKFLANTKNEVAASASGDDLILEFESPEKNSKKCIKS